MLLKKFALILYENNETMKLKNIFLNKVNKKWSKTFSEL